MNPYPSVAVISAPERATPEVEEQLTPEPRKPVEVAAATVILASELDNAETVAVAPDASLRYIVLAPTKAQGEQEATTLGITPVAILTPRSLDGARGVEADQVLVADGLTPRSTTSSCPTRSRPSRPPRRRRHAHGARAPITGYEPHGAEYTPHTGTQSLADGPHRPAGR